MQLRIRARGYTTAMETIVPAARKAAEESGVKIESVLTEDLSISDDLELGRIAVQVKERLAGLDLRESDPESLRRLVLEKAYAIIYGR